MSTVGWIYAGVVACLVLATASLAAFAADARAQRGVQRSVVDVGAGGHGVLARFEAWLSRTPVGRWVREQMTLAGLGYPVWAVVLAGGVVTVTVPWLLWTFVAPAFGVLGLVAGWFGVRAWLGRQRERYLQRFVDQIPELARVLSNATNAGLSIQTAWAVAEAEMSEPARGEIARINTAVRFGASLEEAMQAVEERLPSREVRVLMSTLVIASRSGGSLVSALREISYMLDERKETKREVRTTMAQSVATGYTIILMGVAMLLMLNAILPGTVERMTTNLMGQVALVVGLGLFLVGYLVIRRLTRLDL